jgi:O-antigen/teichoic acid export membrane protein
MSPVRHAERRPMSGSRRFLGGAVWMAAGNWVEQAVNFAVFVVLARLLGIESFGILAMASVIIVLSEFLVRETFAEGMISAPTVTAADRDAAFWLLAGLGAGLTLIIVLAAAPLADLYDTPKVRGLILALSPTVLLIALTAVPVAILRRDLNFRVLSIRAALGVIAGGVVGIGLALYGFSLWALAGQRLVQVTVNVVLAWSAVRWRPGLAAKRADFARVARLGGQIAGLRAAELSATQFPILVVGLALGPASTGLYSLAWRIVEMISFLIIVPLRMVAQPAFAAIAREGGQTGRLLADISSFLGLVAFPLFAGLAAVSPPAVLAMFGPEWRPAAPALAVLCIAGAYFSIEKIQQALCLSAGRAAGLTTIAWGNALLIGAFCLAAAPYGIVAVAGAVVAGYLIPWPLRFRLAASVAGVPVSVMLRPHLLPLVCALVMAACVAILLRAVPALRGDGALAVGIPAGVLVYAALSAAFMPDRLRRLWNALRNPSAAPPEPPLIETP